MFTVEMLPAYLGDSLWIEYGDPGRPSRILVDGGLSGTADAIRDKIDAVADIEGRCRLELLVVTHIDGDHIEGLVKLLGQKGLRLDIDDVWFNGRKHMPDADGEDEERFLGAKQGEYMSALIGERDLPWNVYQDGKTIYVPPEARSTLPRHELPGGMNLTLLSPRYEELRGLSKNWEKELAKAGLDKASQDEVMAALRADRKLRPDDEFLSEDTMDVAKLVLTKEGRDGSMANGASIAFVAEFEGASCLLTGDAWSPVLSAGIDRLLRETNVERLPLNALKVPHHGSKNNLHDELLEQLDTHRFLISTDGGRFDHPDRPSIARMLAGSWRPDPTADEPVDLHFNYRSDSNRVWDDPDLKKQWNYRTHYPAAGAEGLVFDVRDPAEGQS